MNLIAYLKKPDLGLLIIRIGLGAMFMAHGIPKFLAGGSLLESIGKSMSVIGVTSFPLFWGFMAALTESLGGFLMILGYKFRIVMMAFTFMMVVAFLTKFSPGADFVKYAWPAELAVVFFSLIFIGPGKHSVDKG